MMIYKSAIIFSLMMLAVFSSNLLKPNIALSTKDLPNLETIVPTNFNNWRMIQDNYKPISLSIDDERNRDQPYDAVLMETFGNSSGQMIMLAIAYGANQQQEIKIHRPELCYPSQGFKVEELSDIKFEVELLDSTYRFNLTKLISQSSKRRELTLYWIRVGSTISNNPWKIRWNILKGGVSQNIPDGILVRTSQVLSNNLGVEESIKIQKSFIQGMLTSIVNKDNSNLSLFIPIELGKK